MRTSRLPLAGTVILVLLGEASGMAIAQDEGSGPAAVITGSVVTSSTDASEFELITDDGVMQGRGLRITSEFEWSDPRLPSEGKTVANFTGSVETGLAYHYTLTLAGPEGHWTGPEIGFCDTDDRCRGTAILMGHGAYQGLYAVLVTRPQLDTNGDVMRDSVGNITPVFEGAIYPGAAPPMPEPPELPTRE